MIIIEFIYTEIFGKFLYIRNFLEVTVPPHTPPPDPHYPYSCTPNLKPDFLAETSNIKSVIFHFPIRILLSSPKLSIVGGDHAEVSVSSLNVLNFLYYGKQI